MTKRHWIALSRRLPVGSTTRAWHSAIPTPSRSPRHEDPAHRDRRLPRRVRIGVSLREAVRRRVGSYKDSRGNVRLGKRGGGYPIIGHSPHPAGTGTDASRLQSGETPTLLKKTITYENPFTKQT